jgi:hypothetical protein
MNSQRFDRMIEKSLRSRLQKLCHRVPRRERRTVLADVWLVLQGDWGGQIYLTVPWKCVTYNAKIGELLRAMNKQAWGCNGQDGVDAWLTRPRSMAKIEQDIQLDGAPREDIAQSFGFANWEAFVETQGLFVPGGMGGGRLLRDRLWLHDEFEGNDDAYPTEVQPLLNELRGATNEQIKEMNWRERAMKSLGLQLATRSSS